MAVAFNDVTECVYCHVFYCRAHSANQELYFMALFSCLLRGELSLSLSDDFSQGIRLVGGYVEGLVNMGHERVGW